MSRRSAFTLTELLVVIATLGILTGLVFPIIVRVREQGRVASCISNLRQLHAAIVMYAADHSGFLPPRPKFFDEDVSRQFEGWWNLQSYAKTDRIFLCRKAARWNGDPDASGRGYNRVYQGPLPTGDYLKASYDFWPQMYGPPSGDPEIPGRLDVDLNDPAIRMNSIDVAPEKLLRARELGGPLAACLLHTTNARGDEGIVTLMLAGNVRFDPGGKYPW